MRIQIITIAALAGCQLAEPPELIGDRTEPLIGGVVSTDDPAIVALTRGGSSSFCTGTLVSPSVVLTAAHCIDMAGDDPNVTVFFGSDVTSEGTKIGVKTKWQHPGWTGDLGNNNDIGLLLLNFPNKDVEPIPLNTTAASTLVGQSYRVVGFGVYDQPSQTADGKKRTGDTMIADALTPPSGDEIIISDSETIVCFGDSGGPGLVTIGDVEYVAGVHSWTSGNNCGPPNGDTRVDLFVDSDLQDWIDTVDPTCGEDLFCAKSGCTDDPDCQPCGPDGTCVSDCPLPDPDCPTSALGELCRADTQCMTGLCVFWRGDPETKFCSQECSAGSCGDGMSCQNVQPFGDICYYDDDPPGVLGDSCEVATDCGSYQCETGECTRPCDLTIGQGCPLEFECRSDNDRDYYCRALNSEGGGCCRASSSGKLGEIGLLVLVGLLITRRRRR